jgi:hypothetical protein
VAGEDLLIVLTASMVPTTLCLTLFRMFGSDLSYSSPKKFTFSANEMGDGQVTPCGSKVVAKLGQIGLSLVNWLCGRVDIWNSRAEVPDPGPFPPTMKAASSSVYQRTMPLPAVSQYVDGVVFVHAAY